MRYFSTEELRSFAQQTADAMCAVLNMQVTIVDSESRRVAGTGCFSGNIDKHLPAGYVFKRVLSTGKICFLENPGQTEYCKECLDRDICREKATLLVPVKIDGEVIGGIGLAAMTDRERNKLIKNIDDFTSFIVKMADLLATKVKSDFEYSKNLILTNDLHTIIESYPFGIMSIDSLGVVRHFNHNAELILNLLSSEMIGRQYTELISCGLLEQALTKGDNFQSVKAQFKIKRYRNISLILSVKSVMQGEKADKIEKIVCFFQSYKESGEISSPVRDSVKYSYNNIRGESLEIKEILSLVKKMAQSNSTVLITGESGTGKELFAKAIHYESSRQNEPFIAINCSAIPDSLLESELFGYSKGAFTNANTAGKPGKFELANKGTIFLDEIGDMPVNLQAKLLRVLQEKRIERLGDTKAIDIDIRIIAATNKNLLKLIDEKLFREDLYYRINVIPLRLPPLRQRREDIPVLARHFLDKYDAILLKNIKGFLPETLSVLNSYDWPGNIRELENAIEYAVNMESTEFIRPESLPQEVIMGSSDFAIRSKADDADGYLRSARDSLEKIKLKELLATYGDSTKSKAMIAEKLNISLSTLYRKLRKIKD